MRIQDLSVTGPGVHLLPSEVAKAMPCHPKEVGLDFIPGALRDHDKTVVASLLMAYSKSHNAWCGVEWARLRSGILDKLPMEGVAEYVAPIVEKMMEEGLLEVPKRYNYWGFRWLNMFEPKIICPTKKLVEIIWAYRRH